MFSKRPLKKYSATQVLKQETLKGAGPRGRQASHSVVILKIQESGSILACNPRKDVTIGIESKIGVSVAPRKEEMRGPESAFDHHIR